MSQNLTNELHQRLKVLAKCDKIKLFLLISANFRDSETVTYLGTKILYLKYVLVQFRNSRKGPPEHFSPKPRRRFQLPTVYWHLIYRQLFEVPL